MINHAYPRSNRISRPAEFTRVYREGRRIAAAYLQFVYRPNDGDAPRLGLAVAKRVLPRAVDRNRAKRLVRESFRLQKGELPAVDIVFSVRGRKQVCLPDDFHLQLEKLWTRLPKG